MMFHVKLPRILFQIMNSMSHIAPHLHGNVTTTYKLASFMEEIHRAPMHRKSKAITANYNDYKKG